ncbi:MAG TPA: porin [Candidatus Ignatzschineria merdigallinarum]|uniref:Porin n=1 Tax=Candidatus Ignatzschineria merdigallinarum TaxID=2838621 RepID=A0A9D1Q6Y2_9GAMM|nr:porin [Candidatus Ignatzschineria merdigallinarum]
MMKKSIFAVAVASALTLGAAQAETVLYGSIRYDYENSKAKNTLGGAEDNSKRLSNLQDAGSRIGLKGSEDLGNGNAVIYNLEWGFDGMTQDEKNSFTTRKAILGLTGDWGTFTAGRQDNPFKVTIVDDSVQDDFNGKNVISNASQRAMTTTLTGVETKVTVLDANGDVDPVKSAEASAEATAQNFLGNNASYSRVGKVIAYTTPEMAGFQANVAMMMDDSLYGKNDEKNIDLWTINAKYAYDLGANGTLLAKAGYIQGKLADKGKSKAWGLFLGYSQDAFAVTASYADGNHKSKFVGSNVEGPKEKSKGWDLGASFSFGPNYFSTVRATYGQSQVKVEGDKSKVKSWAVGFEQKLSTRTRAWVEYGNEKTTVKQVEGSAKNNVISIGMRHDF